MIKKISIVGLVLIVGAILVVKLNWGKYESDLKKSEIDDSIEHSTNAVSLDSLAGKYISKKGSSEIMFTVDGMQETIGGFTSFNISLDVKEDYTKSNISVSIDTKSINTGNEMRDEHLLTDEFFNAEKFPKISFTSNEISIGDSSFIATGNLTMSGITHKINIPFKHLGSVKNKKGEVFQGNLEIDRTLFGQTEDPAVGSIVKMKFYCELFKE